MWFNIKHSISLSIFRWYIGEFQICIAEYNQGIYSLILLQANAIIDGKTMNFRSEWKNAQPFEQDGKNVKQNFIFWSNYNFSHSVINVGLCHNSGKNCFHYNNIEVGVDVQSKAIALAMLMTATG